MSLVLDDDDYDDDNDDDYDDEEEAKYSWNTMTMTIEPSSHRNQYTIPITIPIIKSYRCRGHSIPWFDGTKVHPGRPRAEAKDDLPFTFQMMGVTYF